MGYWDDKKPPKENFATRDDIAKLETKLNKLINKEEKPSESGGKKLVKSVAHGLGDIGKSLASPENKRRIRISQMVEGHDNPLRTTKVENPIAGRGAGMKKHKISNAP